ncbi:MAG: hypothetical protein ACKO22_07310 [Cyanobium sp.]
MTVFIDHALRLRTLWLVWLLAMVFHVDLGQMPLFHGHSAEIHGQVPEQALPWLYGAMMVYFVLPLAALVLIAWAASVPSEPARWRWWQRLHFWFSVVYTVTNLPHLITDIVVPDGRADQIALMAVLVLVGLLINREGLLWWRQAVRAPGKPSAGQVS